MVRPSYSEVCKARRSVRTKEMLPLCCGCRFNFMLSLGLCEPDSGGCVGNKMEEVCGCCVNRIDCLADAEPNTLFCIDAIFGHQI